MRIVVRLFNDNENFPSLPTAIVAAVCASGWDLELASPLPTHTHTHIAARPTEWTFHQRDARLSPSGHLFNLPPVIEPCEYCFIGVHTRGSMKCVIIDERGYNNATIT